MTRGILTFPYPKETCSMRMHTVHVAALVLSGAMLWICGPAQAQDGEGKFTVHGYLTQAYAKSDNLPINGINKKATWDYRVLALQGRYTLSTHGNFTVQVQHRRSGTSLVSEDG